MTLSSPQQAHKREPGTKATAKIVVVDDHPIVRHGLVQLISQAEDLEVCGEADNGTTALELIATLAPDLVTVDLSLPGKISGMDVVASIAQANGTAPGSEGTSGTKALVISMLDQAMYAEQVLQVGAAGFVEKERATEQLLEAIRQVLRGGIYVPAAMRDRMIARAAHKGSQGITDPVVTLSDRETQVFELIGQGLTTDQVATQLGVSPKTVHTYRQHIMAKLMLETSNQLAVRAATWVRQKQVAPAEVQAIAE